MYIVNPRIIKNKIGSMANKPIVNIKWNTKKYSILQKRASREQKKLANKNKFGQGQRTDTTNRSS